MASEDFATEAQIKRLYAVLHSLGHDPKAWKKGQNIASYAKLTRAQCSDLIDELEQEEAEKQSKHAEAEGKRGEDIKNGVQKQMKGPGDVSYDEEGFVQDQTHAEAEVSKMAVVMRFCVREANAIVEQEINGGGLSEATRATATQKIAGTMFIEAMRRGL